MKTILLATALLASSASFAATINSGTYDAALDAIVLEVSYGGGCAEHYFDLQVGGCLESMPVQCTADLLHTSDKPDTCEAYLHQTLTFPLSDYGLDDGYYSGATIKIKGDGDSSATVTLPRN